MVKILKKIKRNSKKEKSPSNQIKDIKDNFNIKRKEENINQSKDINLQKFSKAIDKELTKNLLPPTEISVQADKNKNYSQNSEESIYQKMRNNYIKNNLNINILSMITQLINTSTTLPKELRNNYPLNNILVDIVKELMFNDLEIVYFSLFLDNFGWINEYYDIKDNLVITALSVKQYLNKDIEIIENHLNKNYENISEKYSNWIFSQNDFKKNIKYTPIMVNERNNLLKKPFNCYCKNYIDYNDAVDKILQLSLPYNEINKHSKKNDKQNKSDTEGNYFNLLNLSNIESENNNEMNLKNNNSNAQKKDINNNIFDDKQLLSFSKYNNNFNLINPNLKEMNLNSSFSNNNKNKRKYSGDFNINNNKFNKKDTQNLNFGHETNFFNSDMSREIFSPFFQRNSSNIDFFSLKPSNSNFIKKTTESF